nr:hypothetical protein [Pandoravirus belohorizontensis]
MIDPSAPSADLGVDLCGSCACSAGCIVGARKRPLEDSRKPCMQRESAAMARLFFSCACLWCTVFCGCRCFVLFFGPLSFLRWPCLRVGRNTKVCEICCLFFDRERESVNV